MDARSFDMLTRRASLLTIGGALTAALATPVLAAAKNKKKKARKVCRRKEKKRCRKDAAACINTLIAGCASSVDPADCVTKRTPCCETCSASRFLTCFVATAS